MKARVLLISFTLAIGALLAGCATLSPQAPADGYPAAGPIPRIKRTNHPIVVIALSGGMAHGFAHIGVLKVLDENGIRPDGIVGTSAGAVVGALYAGGVRGEALVKAGLALRPNQVIELTLPDRGFVNGQRLQNYIDQRLDGRPIQNLGLPFVAVATDLRTGRRVAFTRGDTGMAVRASSSVPAVFQPLVIGRHEYVDGGLVSPVPVCVARALGADIVIAVDVMRQPTADKRWDSISSLASQSIVVMEHALARHELARADVVIRPDLRNISSTDFDLRIKAIAAGERAARAALPQIRALIAEKQRQLFGSAARRTGTATVRRCGGRRGLDGGR
ncbi:MAG: patatin-like phospholipase family protein [Acidiferrobacterales bacterium]